MAQQENSEIKLNLGCASRPLPEYVNIDLDTVEEMRKRYPNIDLPEGAEIFQYDIFNLPFAECTVDEIRADSLLEHLSFIEEPKLFYEVKRVLKPGGIFEFSVPDFEETVRLWLSAKDEWKDFYRNDPEAIAKKHWFGQYSYSTENRWGYLTAELYGPQNSDGQFHKNCYTESKIRGILEHLKFELLEISRYRWKGDRTLMLLIRARKKDE
jgi:predicted SAM-dependent methyltransferase